MQVEFTKVSNFYTGVLMRSVRLLIFFFILAGLYTGFTQSYLPKLALFGLLWFFMLEIFMHYKIGKVRPLLSVSKNTDDFTYSCTMLVLKSAVKSLNGYDFVLKLTSLPQIIFFLERIGITKGAIEKIDIDNESLVEKAAELVKKINAEFITTPDILAAYILASEGTTKLLFKNELKEEDLLNILKWTRTLYSEEEHPDDLYHPFSEGIGESLLSGWTPETQNYTKNITYFAYYNSPQITGRTDEFNEIIETLKRNENNNVLIVGEAGSGKENLVNLLAVESQNGLLPEILNGKKVIELLIGHLMAGATDKGELEGRIEAVIQEVSHAGNIILYIPELQNILGSSSYSLDLSGSLLPYLKKGSLPILASMTKGNFKTYFEKNPLREAFEVITLKEPSIGDALQMVFHKTQAIEAKFRVILTYNSVKQAVSLADRYFPDNALPGSAVTLLEDVANVVAGSTTPNFSNTGKKLITSTLIIQKVQEKSHIAVAAPSAKEKELLLHLEEKMHERIIDQDEAVKLISESLRRLRIGLASQKKPISFLFLGPTGVGKTETAKVLGDIYFGGQENILRLDMSEYSDSDAIKRLLGSSPGQGDERGELTDKIHDNPASLVLLDEFEKASPKIRDLFLQVLEDGRLTDNKGRTVSFLNAIIIATSNAGSQFIREELQKTLPAGRQGIVPDKSFQHKLLNFLQEQNIFTPELLNRFDDVIVFKPLSLNAIQQIVRELLQKIAMTLEEQDITIRFDDAVVEKIATEGQDTQFGARPLLRYIQDNVEDKIAQAKLQDQIQRGDKIVISLSPEREFQITKDTLA